MKKNYTPHSINIIDNAIYNEKIRKWVIPDGTEPNIIMTIPSSGVLSAILESKRRDCTSEIPIFDKKVVGCDPLPEDGKCCVIVSALYATAYAKLNGADDRLFTVADPVYSADGRTILGSLGICPAF